MVVQKSLRWRHNGRDSVSNHQPHDCLLNRSFRRRSKKTSKLRVTGLCAGNSPGTGEFPVQMASNAENVSIWWHHHGNLRTNVPDYAPDHFLWKCLLANATEHHFFKKLIGLSSHKPLPDPMLVQIYVARIQWVNVTRIQWVNGYVTHITYEFAF